ncbi:MAG: M48 family metalloprotease [Alphaproteobacteria bacterium]
MKNKFINSIYFFLITICTLSCGVNPSTGKKEIILMSENEEKQIGKNEHSKIIETFGGIYSNVILQNYIESLGDFLVSTSETPDLKFQFTILNTPIVNAFALPGGYIYLTRGLIVLCQNEAQLAGVIAHEIGHVTARHAARRYTRNIGTNLFTNLLGIMTQNIVISDLINTSASLFLLSYSRHQEYEADELATRYMIRAGFDPNEMGNFLRIMENYSNFQKEILRDKKKVSELLLTHPTSSKRVDSVIKKSKDKIPFNPIIGREIFLKKIDGILFGNKEEEGFFYKNRFIHKSLDFSFQFDESFYFLNNPKYLLGVTSGKTKVVFDIDKKIKRTPYEYLSDWGKVEKCSDFKTNNIKDFKSYSCFIKKNNEVYKLVIIDGEKELYRFALITNKEEYQNFENSFLKITNSFEKVSTNKKLSETLPPKIKILRFYDDEDFLSKLIDDMNSQAKFSKSKFFTINGIKKGEKINFEKVKTIY